MFAIDHDSSAPRPRLPARACAVALCGAAAAATLLASSATVDVPRNEIAILVDGVLDESAWQTALRMPLDFEVRPAENEQAPVQTDVLLTHDNSHLYVAFVARDPEPERIRARFRDRDNVWNDDFVGIVLDTFNDERRAFELMVNPLGVQTDAVNDEVGGRYDTSWDAIWQSAAKITATGWQAELAIPFRQLRFEPTEAAQVWGFDAIRSYPRGDRHHIGLFPRDRGNNGYLQQARKIRGFSKVEPGRNLQLVPTATAGRIDQRQGGARLESGDEEFDLGASGRWGITTNWTLSGTVNPDFSQVEADALRLDVNEQFTLFFPEARPFFLEGADTFSTQMNLVYTRTVADPSAALKLTGKQGAHTVGIFTARDEVTNVLLPGAEGSSLQRFDQETTSTVGRYRYDLGGNSTIGALWTDRRGGDYSNRVGSVDLRWRPTERDTVRAQAAFTSTDYSGGMVAAFDLRDDSTSGNGFQLGYSHSRRNWGVNFNARDLDEGFRADVGFVTRVDLRGFDSDVYYRWWGEPDDWYNRFETAAWVYRNERQSGFIDNEGWGIAVDGQFARETQTRMWWIDEVRGFAGQEFDLQTVGFRVSSNPNRSWRFRVAGDFGDAIDFAGVRLAERTSLRPSTSIFLGRGFVSTLRYNYLNLDVGGSRLLTARAPELRLVYYLNRRLYARLIAQYTEVDTNLAVSSSTTSPIREDLLTQLLVVYEVGPQTAIFVGYGDTWDNEFVQDNGIGTAPGPPGMNMPTFDPRLERSSRSFFFKLSYAWEP